MGLQGRWLDWRAEHEGLAEIPQAIWRGGVGQARSEVEAWEKTNARHARALIKALESDEPIPRAVQRRTPKTEPVAVEDAPDTPDSFRCRFLRRRAAATADPTGGRCVGRLQPAALRIRA